MLLAGIVAFGAGTYVALLRPALIPSRVDQRDSYSDLKASPGMFNEKFEGGGADPHEDHLAWLILIAVALIVAAGFIAHYLLFGSG